MRNRALFFHRQAQVGPAESAKWGLFKAILSQRKRVRSISVNVRQEIAKNGHDNSRRFFAISDCASYILTDKVRDVNV